MWGREENHCYSLPIAAESMLCAVKCGWWWKYCDGWNGRLLSIRQSDAVAKWAACDEGIPGRWWGKPVNEAKKSII